MNRRAEKMKEYRAKYLKDRRRVYGVIGKAEYAKIAEIARRNGRSVWAEIWLEARAYRQGTYLPPREIEDRITELLVAIRRIGVNLNQIAKQQNKVRRLVAPAKTGAEIAEFERVIAEFVSRPWKISEDAGIEKPDDHQITQS